MPVSMLSTSLFSDRKSYGRFNALDTIYTPPSTSKPGMVLINPSSIANSGGSASKGTNGQITFTGVTSVSINGAFSSNFNNYQIHVSHNCSLNGQNFFMRLRTSGSDASGSDYALQSLHAYSTTKDAAASTSQTRFRIGDTDDNDTSLTVADLYTPFIAQPTAFRSIGFNANATAYLSNDIGSHGLSISYDGATFYASGGNITGTLSVYGIRS